LRDLGKQLQGCRGLSGLPPSVKATLLEGYRSHTTGLRRVAFRKRNYILRYRKPLGDPSGQSGENLHVHSTFSRAEHWAAPIGRPGESHVARGKCARSGRDNSKRCGFAVRRRVGLTWWASGPIIWKR